MYMKTMKSKVSPTVSIAEVGPVAWMMAITRASMHQARASPIAAHVSASIPTLVPNIFFSARRRASTGKAVMAMAVPTRSINETRVAFGPVRPG